MRRVLITTVAALALGLSGAVAAPMHGPSGSFGGRGGDPPAGVAKGGVMGAPQTSAGGNFKTNNFSAQSNLGARNYAWNGHGHRRGYGGVWGWGGGWGGLYAYEPGYDACYDYGYGPYYNGYYNDCYYGDYGPGPGFSFGWSW